MTNIYIDGKAGTTGLRIYDRLSGRSDINLMLIDEDKRKDPLERAKMINASDITFLCLPDAAAIEAVSLVENNDVKIIDTSTAHRTNPCWSYGFPELSPEHRAAIALSKRVSVPGCHASGFNSLVYPLVKNGIIPADYPVVCFSVTGYSGGGKSMIAQYDDNGRSAELSSPRQYGTTQNHKHLREMKAVPGLAFDPVFSPIVDDYYSGMVVTVPIFSNLMKHKMTVCELRDFFSGYYKSGLVSVSEEDAPAFVGSNNLSGKDSMEIIVGGNDERILLISLFDNLGKGASGAAIQCMNIMLGLDEKTGLDL